MPRSTHLDPPEERYPMTDNDPKALALAEAESIIDVLIDLGQHPENEANRMHSVEATALALAPTLAALAQAREALGMLDRAHSKVGNFDRAAALGRCRAALAAIDALEERS